MHAVVYLFNFLILLWPLWTTLISDSNHVRVSLNACLSFSWCKHFFFLLTMLVLSHPRVPTSVFEDVSVSCSVITLNCKFSVTPSYHPRFTFLLRSSCVGIFFVSPLLFMQTSLAVESQPSVPVSLPDLSYHLVYVIVPPGFSCSLFFLLALRFSPCPLFWILWFSLFLKLINIRDTHITFGLTKVL